MGGSKKKILLLEDDKFISRAYKDGLERAGFEMYVINEGEQIDQALAVFQPDLLLLDLILPGIDGFGVLEKLRNQPKYQKLPVMVLSNLSQESDKTRARKLGAVDYLVKAGLSLNELVQRIQGHFEQN